MITATFPGEYFFCTFHLGVSFPSMIYFHDKNRLFSSNKNELDNTELHFHKMLTDHALVPYHAYTMHSVDLKFVPEIFLAMVNFKKNDIVNSST